MFYADNGSDFTSSHLERGIGESLQPAPERFLPKQPWDPEPVVMMTGGNFRLLNRPLTQIEELLAPADQVPN